MQEGKERTQGWPHFGGGAWGIAFRLVVSEKWEPLVGGQRILTTDLSRVNPVHVAGFVLTEVLRLQCSPLGTSCHMGACQVVA